MQILPVLDNADDDDDDDDDDNMMILMLTITIYWTGCRSR